MGLRFCIIVVEIIVQCILNKRSLRPAGSSPKNFSHERSEYKGRIGVRFCIIVVEIIVQCILNKRTLRPAGTSPKNFSHERSEYKGRMGLRFCIIVVEIIVQCILNEKPRTNNIIPLSPTLPLFSPVAFAEITKHPVYSLVRSLAWLNDQYQFQFQK